jgi:WXG100 family type VII secretion target
VADASSGGFQVDLGELANAINRVSAQRDTMQGGIQGLNTTLSNIEDAWRGPAGSSFTGLVNHFNSVSSDLMSLLDEAISRMHATHQNYASAVTANTQNLQ